MVSQTFDHYSSTTPNNGYVLTAIDMVTILLTNDSFSIIWFSSIRHSLRLRIKSLFFDLHDVMKTVGGAKTKFLTYVKLVLISDTYCILIFAYPYCYRTKRNELTRSTSLDRVDSELVKRLRGNLTKNSHVTAQTCH